MVRTAEKVALDDEELVETGLMPEPELELAELVLDDVDATPGPSGKPVKVSEVPVPVGAIMVQPF